MSKQSVKNSKVIKTKAELKREFDRNAKLTEQGKMRNIKDVFIRDHIQNLERKKQRNAEIQERSRQSLNAASLSHNQIKHRNAQ